MLFPSGSPIYVLRFESHFSSSALSLLTVEWFPAEDDAPRPVMTVNRLDEDDDGVLYDELWKM